MTTALIFAGGTGSRMNSKSIPKQFLEVHGKPVIIYTLEHFEYHNDIDEIVIVCLMEWIERLRIFLNRFGITKVTDIVSGGNTGHDSIYNGLVALKKRANPKDIVLIHDGVRPLITEELISKNIEAVKEFGNGITVEYTRETVVQSMDGSLISSVFTTHQAYLAKAPQSFYFKDIVEIYDKANEDGFKSIDSAHLLSVYDKPMHVVKSTKNNIKITEPADYYLFRALCKVAENQQIFGI